MPNKPIPFKFDAWFDSASFAETTDPTLRLGKVRAFYKYMNRNGSYISDDFAAKLAISAYRKPIVGTYDYSVGDFKGHEAHDEAKSYGYVIPDSLTWEDHVDSDGVMRRYATYDVLIWAKYWTEAATIFDKTQSMEIDPETIRGDWQYVCFEGNEEYAYVYTDGVMAGLCVLGADRTPCFEGAAFFSTDDDSYKQFTAAIQKYYENGGMDTMDEPTVVTTDEVTLEEPVVETEHEIEAVTEPAAEPEVEPTTEHEVEPEPQIDYEAQINELQAQYDAVRAELEQLRSDYESLQSEKAALDASYEALTNDNTAKDATIAAQNDTIATYENAEKDRIMAQFTSRLPADVISQIEEAKGNMSIDELNTHLALEYTKFSMSREQTDEIRVPQLPQEEPTSGSLARILNKYKR